MARLHSADIQSKLKDINDYINKEYNLTHPKKKRDWRTYEQQFTRRASSAMKMLNPLVHEAASAIQIVPAAGHPHSISLEDRLKLLLIKQLIAKSNRVFSNMLFMFSMLAGIEVSYKTIERLYSDPEVMLAVHNLHVLLLRKKGVNSSNATGDGTGYSLTIKKNYGTYAQKLKNMANPGRKRRKLFAYMFTLMDLDTRLYIAIGSSLKSEKEAFDRAAEMLARIDVEIDTVRLDKYYSSPTYVDKFGGKVYIIPKKNATLRGSQKWRNTMKEFVQNTMDYLEQYHQRSNSEAGFAADKKMFGWGVAQRRYDRIDSALLCKGLWHNLFNFDR